MKGDVIKCDLKNDWESVSSAFENALVDIGEISNDSKIKTHLETWYEIIKKIMRLWQSGNL